MMYKCKNIRATLTFLSMYKLLKRDYYKMQNCHITSKNIKNF